MKARGACRVLCPSARFCERLQSGSVIVTFKEQSLSGTDSRHRACSTRALVVEDHPFLHEAITRSLEETGIQSITHAATVASAREAMKQGRPELAVLDIRLPDGSGLDLLAELAGTGTRVVVFSASEDSYCVRAAFAAGAAGYVLKTAPTSGLGDALQAVMSGEVYVDPAVAALLVTGLQLPSPGTGLALSDVELDVLRLAAEGASNPQIARRLNTSAVSVKAHFARMGRKLGATDRTHMVALAFRADLLR